MPDQKRPISELFSRVYCDRATLIDDSVKFRTRIGSYCDEELDEFLGPLARYLARESVTGVKSAFDR